MVFSIVWTVENIVSATEAGILSIPEARALLRVNLARTDSKPMGIPAVKASPVAKVKKGKITFPDADQGDNPKAE